MTKYSYTKKENEEVERKESRGGGGLSNKTDLS